MKFPHEDAMTLLFALIDGGRLNLAGDGITITLPNYPDRPQSVDSWRLQHLEDRGWVVIAETVSVTDQGRYAAKRYADRVFGRTRRPHDLGVTLAGL